jgi:hypothetical protein
MYKVGVPIVVVYQSSGGATGKTVAMDIYDETYALDATKSVAAMTEMGTTGRYYATFTPDAEGEWVAMMQETSQAGKVVKAFTVVGHNIDSIGDAVAAVAAKTDNLPTDPADQSLVEAAITAAESNIRGPDSDTLKTIADQLDALESPPMVG